MRYVPVVACCTKCEPFLSSSSRHFVQLVHKEFVGGNKQKDGRQLFPSRCCVLFEIRYVALFDGVLMKSQISLVSQREVESMKKLVLLSVLQKSLQVWVWEWREIWWWPLINFTFITLFSTPKIIIPVHSSSCQFHRLKESQPTNLVSGDESWCTLTSNPI